MYGSERSGNNDNKGKLKSNKSYIIKPQGFTIPYNSEKVHGISTEIALKEGHNLEFVLKEFENDCFPLWEKNLNNGLRIWFSSNSISSSNPPKQPDIDGKILGKKISPVLEDEEVDSN